MTTAIARQAIRAWPRHELATRQQIKTLRRGFIRQLQHLGDRYLFAREQFVTRKAAQSQPTAEHGRRSAKT